MRSRIIAILLLALILGGPIFFYWYFYRQSVSSVIFRLDPGAKITISLSGKLEYRYFPLLDRIFQYRSTCIGSCIFSPIPPMKYDIVIARDGVEDILDSILLERGKTIEYRVPSSPDVIFRPVGSLISSLRDPMIDGFRYVGESAGARVILWRVGQVDEIGIFRAGGFTPLISSVSRFRSVTLDRSRQYIIAETEQDETYIYSTDGLESTVFPYREEILSVSREKELWKVRTKNRGVMLGNEGRWEVNPRFTDYIDLDTRHRLGYVDILDNDRWSLSSGSETRSHLILLDRIENQTTLIKSGIEIDAFYEKDMNQYMLDRDGNLSQILLIGK